MFGVVSELELELESEFVSFIVSAYTSWRNTGDTEMGVTAAEETRIAMKQKDRILFLLEIFSLGFSERIRR